MNRIASRTTCITACSSHSEQLYNQTNLLMEVHVHVPHTSIRSVSQPFSSGPTVYFSLSLSLSLQEVAEILDVGGSESTYKDSNIFLKGTQSANPHNDYSQHFVDIGQRPQNFIRDVGKWARLCTLALYRYQQ